MQFSKKTTYPLIPSSRWFQAVTFMSPNAGLVTNSHWFRGTPFSPSPKGRNRRIAQAGKPNIAGWNIPVFNRKIIFNPGPFSIGTLVLPKCTRENTPDPQPTVYERILFTGGWKGMPGVCSSSSLRIFEICEKSRTKENTANTWTFHSKGCQMVLLQGVNSPSL